MPMSEEHKAKMREGRRKAAEERKAKGEKLQRKQTKKVSASVSVVSTRQEFVGISKADCPVDCTIDRCCITGGPHCGHPMKGGIQPIHMINPDIKQRYDRARKHLAHVEVDKRP